MTRLPLPLVCAIVAALTLGFSGCGQKSADTSSKLVVSSASAAPDAQASSTDASDSSGVIDYRTKDPATLGIPLYPGAKTTEGGSVGSSDKTGSGQVVNLTSPDSFDTVYGWYKSQLPADAQKMKTSVMGASTATFQVGPGDEKTGKFVTVSSTGKGDTFITLSVGNSTGADAGSSPAPSNASADQSTGLQHDDLGTFGVPTYPNATESVMLPAMIGDEGKSEHGQLTTKDSFSTVYAWYKPRLRAGSEDAEAAASNHINSDGDEGAMFEISKDPEFNVVISRSKGDDETTVVFLRLTKVK
ncbi:MAG TPA: hypothetical protein VII69_00280 [Candidatus Eremiobacteraceae bacterium]